MNLLDRTRRLFQGLAPPSPAKVQYYSVSCAEGHRLRGERTSGYQALRCPTCGEGMFILPSSPLPEPAAPSAAREAPAPRDTMTEREDEPIELSDPLPTRDGEFPEFDADIDWVEEPGSPSQEPPTSTQPAQPPAAQRPRAEAPKRPRPKPAAPRPEPRPVVVERSESFGEWARRRRNPLIFMAVALVVVGTVGFRLWRSSFRDLPRIAQLGLDEGLPALDSGDFDTAHQILADARRAVDSLGGAFEGADDIRHGADEAAIFTSMTEPLETILAEASADAKERSARFDTYYRGKSILVVDARVTRTPDASGAGEYDLDYRILPGGEGVPLRVGRIDLTGFRLFELARPRVGDVVRFGARLESMTLVNKEWRVTLVPDSGVFMTHPRALEAKGIPGASDTAREAEP